jgi:hypothetical protein
MGHVKPTRAELEANAAAALAEDERLKAEEAAAAGNPPQETPEQKAIREAQEAEAARIAEDERIAAEAAAVGDGGETPEEKAERERIAAEAAEKAAQPVDWKKRYTDSSREAKVLATKNKEINDAFVQAAEIALPTDEEMKAEYPEWEDMTSTEQRFATENLINKKRFDVITSAVNKFKKVEDWNVKVDTFVDNPKTLIANPELEGKTDEFRIFASKPTRSGMDFDDLVLAFLGDEAKKIKPDHKGQKMFENGTGGSKVTPPPPDDKLSLDQSIIDRKTNFPLYKERLKAGKYKTE